MKRITAMFLTVLVLLLSAGMLFAAAQKEAATDEVTISFWHFPQVRNVPGYADQSKEFGDFWAYLAKEFSAKDNGIKVVTELIPWEGGFERFNIAIAGGTPPTIGFDYLGRTGQYYAMGAAVAADDVLPASLINDTNSSILDIYRVEGGKYHALPGFAWNAGMMVINVGLLEKHGWTGPILNGPGQPFTFDEWVAFLEKARKVLPAGIFPAAFSCGDEQGDYTWWSIFWGMGGSLFENGKVTTNPAPIIEGYNLIKSLRDKGLVASGIASMRGNEVNDLFYSGLSAMNGGSVLTFRNAVGAKIRDGVLDIELKLMPVPFPTKSGDIGYSSIGPTGFIFMTKDPAEQNAASQWVQYVMGEDIWPKLVKGTGQFMLQNRFADIDIYAGDPDMEIVQNMLGRFGAGDFGLAHPQYQKIRIAMSEAGQKVFTGMASVEDAVAGYLRTARQLNNE